MFCQREASLVCTELHFGWDRPVFAFQMENGVHFCAAMMRR